MEKVFRPQWFVLYCGVFIVLWAALQYVANARLKEDAQRWGAYVFNWTWPEDGWASQARMIEADVLSKNDHDAVVKVKGRQQLWVQSGHTAKGAWPEVAPQFTDCIATLTLYRRATDKGVIWELGEVQFP